MFRLIYTSRLMQRMSRPEFEGLCRAAVRKNQKSQVSGLLLFSGTEFLQCLEGPDKENVAEIYRSIVLDDRHQDIRLLLSQSVPEPLFKGWAMRGLMLRQPNENDNKRLPYHFLDQRLDRPWNTLGSGAISLMYEYARVKLTLEQNANQHGLSEVFDVFGVYPQPHSQEHENQDNVSMPTPI
jgi:hypothetical protein